MIVSFRRKLTIMVHRAAGGQCVLWLSFAEWLLTAKAAIHRAWAGAIGKLRYGRFLRLAKPFELFMVVLRWPYSKVYRTPV